MSDCRASVCFETLSLVCRWIAGGHLTGTGMCVCVCLCRRGGVCLSSVRAWGEARVQCVTVCFRERIGARDMRSAVLYIWCGVVMQGRTGKSSRKELVIESPQQFKYVPVQEEEEDSGGPQVRHTLICHITHTLLCFKPGTLCCILWS